MSQLLRFFQVADSCSDTCPTTTGIVEGCGFAIPRMLCIAPLVYYGINSVAPQARTLMFADNWTVISNDTVVLKIAFEQIVQTLEILRMKISRTKSWTWATCTKMRKELVDFAYDDQKIPVVLYGKDLGTQQIYSKKKSTKIFQARTKKAVQKLHFIKKARVPRGFKKHYVDKCRLCDGDVWNYDDITDKC